jgi:hypothetical protein
MFEAVRAQEPVVVLGEPSRADLDSCWELGAAMAAWVQES